MFPVIQKRIISISIHALRGEGDSNSINAEGRALQFQSTPSVGRATLIYFLVSSYPVISIHALRGEGDTAQIFLRAI